MKPGNLEGIIDITLQNVEADMSYLTLSLGAQQQSKLHLSLHEARKLARNLIQHVHQAEVRDSLKKIALKGI